MAEPAPVQTAPGPAGFPALQPFYHGVAPVMSLTGHGQPLVFHGAPQVLMHAPQIVFQAAPAEPGRPISIQELYDSGRYEQSKDQPKESYIASQVAYPPLTRIDPNNLLAAGEVTSAETISAQLLASEGRHQELEVAQPRTYVVPSQLGVEFQTQATSYQPPPQIVHQGAPVMIMHPALHGPHQMVQMPGLSVVMGAPVPVTTLPGGQPLAAPVTSISRMPMTTFPGVPSTVLPGNYVVHAPAPGTVLAASGPGPVTQFPPGTVYATS